MGKLIDLTGKKFGRLTVLGRDGYYISPKGQKEPTWLCKCDCGNIISTRGSQLRGGIAKSCGCLQRDIVREMSRKYNTYDLTGDYGIGYTFKGEEFYFDLEDYNKIKDYCWCKSGNYIITHINQNKMLLMHRLIMDCYDANLIVDHIHGTDTTNDNRKSNLRIGTHKQNMMNRQKPSCNKSGETGVIWDKTKNMWMAYIGIDNKHKHIGYFDSFDDAVKARKEAEEKYFGEYSYDNSQSS